MASKCPICSKTCNNTFAIQCNNCSKWYHCDCINMQKAKLNYFERESKHSEGKRWICKPCKSEVKENKNKSENQTKIAENRKETNERDYTLKDVMGKLQLMDQRQCDLLKKYEGLKVN
ncbi:hypothetical protein JTB14_021306 [Gonioctena quinquepunctata]|nr:hypothetical protein JTB14_021306 [Gonioctena quinquepunctata]